MIIFKSKNDIKFFSKVNFDDKFTVLNKKFINRNIDNLSEFSCLTTDNTLPRTIPLIFFEQCRISLDFYNTYLY